MKIKIDNECLENGQYKELSKNKEIASIDIDVERNQIDIYWKHPEGKYYSSLPRTKENDKYIPFCMHLTLEEMTALKKIFVDLFEKFSPPHDKKKFDDPKFIEIRED